MKRLSLAIAFIFCGNIFIQAQVKTDEALPLDPKIRSGVLPNGMKYFIQKNTKPEKRAELRMAVNAGSTMENDDQQGLAHFVEHMAFNGSKNFKKNELVDYLEGIGTKFGPDLNAYTSFDETVYMLQIPTDKEDIYKKGFLILEDWAHNLSFDSLEIDKERGVVTEEWRLGQGAFERMSRKFWPVLFKDSRYADRIPIGKPEILKNCKHSTLKQYYYDWYRPDNQAIIVVGDVDVDATEKLIKEQFSKIPSVKNPKPVQSWPIPDQKDLRVCVLSDKESPYNVLQLQYAQPPDKYKTVGDFRDHMKEELFNNMMNARLSELAQKPNAPFMFAGAGYSGFVRNKNSYGSFCVFPNGKAEAALTAVVTEDERVRRYGFLPTEFERAKKKMLAETEKQYNEREKTESKQIVNSIVQYFLVGDVVPGIEKEYAYTKDLISGITLDEINALPKTWIRPKGENGIIIYMMAEKDGNKIPTEEEVRSQFAKAENNQVIDKYEDKVVNEPLVAKRPRGQKVIKSEDRGNGITEWTIGNGARVFIKPTDFKDDEIMFSAHSWGGTNLYSDKDFRSANASNALQEEMGYGKFDKITLQKFLQGKTVSLNAGVGEIDESLNGSSSKKDLETLMQLIYAAFSMPRKDSAGFQSYVQMQKGFIQNAAADPNSVFRDSVQYIMSGYSFRHKPETEQSVNDIDMNRAYSIYKERFSDPTDFVFTFVGSFNPDSLKPLVESYIGGISAAMKHETPVDLKAKAPKGTLKKEVKKGNNPRSTVQLFWTGDCEYNRKTRFEMRALSNLMNIKLRENLREDKGGVYGVGLFPQISHFPKGNYKLIEYFSCAPDNVEKLISASLDEINDVKKNGCNDVNLGKIKETLLKERETQLKENSFWMGAIGTYAIYNESLADLAEYNNWVNSLKSDDFKKWANSWFNDKEFKRFVLNPEK
jgi:zinc protease